MSVSYIGAKVRLLRDHTTKGGITFKKGVVMRVYDSNAHGMWLSCHVRGFSYNISGVSKHEVELVELKKKKREDEEP